MGTPSPPKGVQLGQELGFDLGIRAPRPADHCPQAGQPRVPSGACRREQQRRQQEDGRWPNGSACPAAPRCPPRAPGTRARRAQAARGPQAPPARKRPRQDPAAERSPQQPGRVVPTREHSRPATAPRGETGGRPGSPRCKPPAQPELMSPLIGGAGKRAPSSWLPIGWFVAAPASSGPFPIGWPKA